MPTMAPPEQIPAERFERIDERFDRVDERLVEVNRRITEGTKETDRRLKEVNQRITETAEGINRRITENAEETRRRITGLETAQVELRQAMESLQATLSRGSLAFVVGSLGVLAAVIARGG